MNRNIYLNCKGKKIIVSSKIAKILGVVITILRPSESVNVLKDWKEFIRLAVKSIFTTESHICGILKRRLGKYWSPNEIAPRRFLLGILYKRSSKRSLQFSLSWTQFIKNWLSAQMLSWFLFIAQVEMEGDIFANGTDIKKIHEPVIAD